MVSMEQDQAANNEVGGMQTAAQTAETTNRQRRKPLKQLAGATGLAPPAI